MFDEGPRETITIEELKELEADLLRTRGIRDPVCRGLVDRLLDEVLWLIRDKEFLEKKNKALAADLEVLRLRQKHECQHERRNDRGDACLDCGAVYNSLDGWD